MWTLRKGKNVQALIGQCRRRRKTKDKGEGRETEVALWSGGWRKRRVACSIQLADDSVTVVTRTAPEETGRKANDNP